MTPLTLAFLGNFFGIDGLVVLILGAIVVIGILVVAMVLGITFLFVRAGQKNKSST